MARITFIKITYKLSNEVYMGYIQYNLNNLDFLKVHVLPNTYYLLLNIDFHNKLLTTYRLISSTKTSSVQLIYSGS